MPIILPQEEPNESKLEQMAKYLLAGRFVLAGLWEGHLEEALEKYRRLMRGRDFWSERLPDDDAIFSALFDIRGGLPALGSADVKWYWPIYLSGYGLRGRMVGVSSFDTREFRQLQMAINTFIYALTQEGSMTRRLMQMVYRGRHGETALIRGLILAAVLSLWACGGVRHMAAPSSAVEEEAGEGMVHPVPAGIAALEAGNGPYYYRQPRETRQPSATYFEGPAAPPLATYHQARRLWEGFEEAVAALSPLSQALKGWHMVLDPGHGGLDPGAIVSSRDGQSKPLFVVEDEYVYDVVLRVYILLRRHGATVTLTLLSPNHLLRRSQPPTQTFVHEKNEVYNSLELNQSNTNRQWPQRDNLDARVAIARRAFDQSPPGRRLFLSFHADLEPKAPKAPLVLYYAGKDGRQDLASRDFAGLLQETLGGGGHVRGQSLGVLRHNPADLKVLVELRNMAYPNHVWALRSEPLRQQDAEKVVEGLLRHALRQGRGP
ncbi:MAG: N-acetylmuramoyl-L-alanine amidase [Candidatus Handelsmanbacteria bacterium]|nr:N-acetylmuramoyl-L-alanine amidase [Candidatus Handelsmanbacteria bacterium]